MPHFSPNQLPNPFVRDFDGDCEWWRYELRGGRYVRVYCPCKYGDAEISYRRDVRAQWADYDFSQESGPDGLVRTHTSTRAPVHTGQRVGR